MDKNYNIDDILLDIKSKKSRRKEQEAPEPSALGGAEEFPTARRGASPAPPPPEAFPRPERADSKKDFTVTIPQEEPEPPSQADAEPSPLTPKTPSSKKDFTVTIPEEDLEPAIREQATGKVDLSALKGEKPNPMNFDGHVQSITDRAKMRQKYGRFAPQRQERNDDTTVIDFSAFRAGVLEAADAVEEEGEDLGETRVLPKLGASRELSVEELRSRKPAVLGVDDDDTFEEFEGFDEEGEDDFEEDYDDGELHRPAVDFSEYNSVDDRRDVAIDIARVKLWLVIRLVITALLSGILVYLVLAGNNINMPLPSFLFPETNLKSYLMSLTVVSVLVALAGSSAMGGGLISLFRMRANSDTLAALAMLGVIGQCVFAVVRPELVRLESLTLYCCVAALSMLFNALGKTAMISRIQANFKIISSGRPKKAVVLAEDESFCRHFVKGTPRRPAVAIAAKTDFFTDFLALSYSDKYDVGINKVVAPICLAGAVVVGILTYILTKGDTMSAVTALTAILCIAATFSATFIENIPLGKLTKKLAPKGGMVSGNKAVEDFCDVSAVVLSETDLFPQGHIQIHGIRPFENGRVDEAILDAASVVCAAGSAMSSVFLGMVGGNKKLLKPVENITYENGRGISAWVSSQRVLVGNHKMMQAHGITLPQESFDQKYTQEGGEVFYLAVGGEASARFLVSYHIDEELAVELDRLAALEKTLIVYTIDPNLDAEKIWSLYSYPERLVKIIPAELHDKYKELTSPREQALAEIAYTGRASAMMGSILACVQARSSILAATVVQLIQIALGYGFVALVAFLGTMGTLSVPVLIAYQFFWFLVIALIQKLRSA